MKLIYLVLIVWCFAAVSAQRRASKPELTESEPTQSSRALRRGRTRFVSPEETAPAPTEETKSFPARRVAARRRPVENAQSNEQSSVGRRNYEVEEVLDDTPIEPYRRNNLKSRVLTESRYEAANAPTSNSLFQPSTTESLDDLIKSIGSELIDAATTPAPAPTEAFSEPVVQQSSETPKNENELKRELPRRQPEAVSSSTAPSRNPENRRRVGVRRNNVSPRTEESTTAENVPTSRNRARTRAPKKTEDVSTAPPAAARTNFRTLRRRPAEATEGTPTRTRGPSVLSSSESAELPTRSRTGRKIPTKNEEPTKITLDLPQARSGARSRLPTSRQRSEASTEAASSKPIARNRSRFRSIDQPPVIDEQKLEVLPLFESEEKTVRPLKYNVSNNKSRNTENSANSVETSATDNDIKITQKPKIKVTTPSNVVVSRKQSVNIETESSYKNKRKPIVSKPTIKESVIISEVTEVTSKRTVSRKPTRASLPVTANKFKKIKSGDDPKVSATEVNNRSRKKSEISKAGKASSEEEIDESDNYPEAFKALLQAKKQGKESRSKVRVEGTKPITKTTERIVTSSASPSTTTTSATSSVPLRKQIIEDFDNEVEFNPSSTTALPPSARPTRRRYVKSTTEKTIRSTSSPQRKITRTTATPTATFAPIRETHRFHAKVPSTAEPENAEKVTRNYSAKTRGLYSSRKNQDIVIKSAKSAQILQAATTPKKANRYSSRYRTEASARGTIRTSTNAPAYLPTIPTVTPSTTVNSPVEDKDLGLEVLTIDDDPVNTVPSANLVKGDFVTETSAEKVPLVAEAQTKTEKPVSIIERIINSITAISTEAPNVPKITTPGEENAAKQSAILKLATKKPTKLDKNVTKAETPTKDSDNFVTPSSSVVTTDKPTTIIERILSSLSAIQAENSTDAKNVQSKQVRSTNFNTLSFPSTTPLSRVPKSTHSAPSSTSINPLSVLDEISNEQTLQKRTIGKLLALLNSLTSTTENPRNQQLVVVTPKKTFLSSTLETTTETVTNTAAPTTEQVTTTITTTNAPFTTPIPKTTENTTPSETMITTVMSTSQPSTTPIDDGLTTITAQSTSTTQDLSNELGAVLPLFVDPSVTSLVTDSTTPSTVTTTDSSLSVGTTISTEPTTFNTEPIYTFPSTLPDVVNFEVSPGSVSIFSANDLLSNAITPDDLSSTITVSTSRTNSPELTTTQFNQFTDGTTTTEPSVASSPLNALDLTTTVDVSTTSLPLTTTETTAAPLTTTAATTISPPSSVNSTDNMSNVANNSSSNLSNRSGRLLDGNVQDADSNSIVDNNINNNQSSTIAPDRDYFIFAVLNNNTVLRKRPERFPNKETPFLIVGVYPNNTIVRKFPNGTLVPMEPIIRVEQNTIPSVEANALSVKENSTTESISTTPSSTSSTTTSISPETSTILSSSTVETTTIPVTTTAKSTTTTVTLPSLSEILNGRTVQAFNNIINISELTKKQAETVSNTVPSTTQPAVPPTLSNRILETTTLPPITTTGIPTTTVPPTTTPILTTQPATTNPPTTTPSAATTTQRQFTTIFPTLSPVFRTTTGRAPSSTLFPVFLQNLLSTLQPTTTELPATNRPKINFDLVSASTTSRAISTTPQPVTTTFIPTVTPKNVRSTTANTLFTSSLSSGNVDINQIVKGKELTEQQRKDLEAIQRLEEEQKNLLKQLSLLTNLNLSSLNGNKKERTATTTSTTTTTTTTTERSDLANRIIALAVERDKNKQAATTQPPTTTTPDNRQPKKLIDRNQPIDEIVKQLNQAKPTSVDSPYGTSNDAIIAALLKDQGIGPTTPESVLNIYAKTTTTTRRPRTTTRPPGPLMQSLNWLLNALAPPTTKRPKPKPKPKPKKQPEEELLTHQPTHITPVVTAAPPKRQNLVNSLSQDEIKKLIGQLEDIQKNPESGKNLDLTSFKSLQGLINSDQASRGKERPTRNRVVKSTTSPPVSVSNSILEEDDEEFVSSTTRRPKPSVPPLKLRPVPGIEEGDTMVRGQLLTAAVNVTRAISSFLGTALQDAAQQFAKLFASGSGSSSSLLSLASGGSRPSQ